MVDPQRDDAADPSSPERDEGALEPAEDPMEADAATGSASDPDALAHEGEDGTSDDSLDVSSGEGDAPVFPDADEPPAPRILLRLEGLEKHYGDEVALGPVDAHIDGRCIGLLGPNGAGKSTLLRILIGVMHPTAGRAELLGHEVGPNAVGLRRRIGYAPEGEAQFPGLTGVESVAYAGRLVGMSAPDAMQRAHQVLDYVGLLEARYRLVSTYSTGMRQRLKIAQALVHDPEILILDEPTEGVDPQARDEIVGLIDELSREHGIHIIVSTHLLADVERLATHVMVLDKGHIAASGPIEELRRGGETGYVLRVAGDPTPLTERLDAAGVTWRAVEPELRIQTDDPAMLLRHIQEAGLVVRHLAPVSLRLDEAFEQAVGGADA